MSEVAALVQVQLDRYAQQARPRTGSLIISVWGDAIYPRGGRVWLGSLIQLLEPLGVSERLLRTSVFRLVQENWLATETHGRKADYFLTVSGQRRIEEAASSIYAPVSPSWDHRWRLLQVVEPLTAAEREALRAELYWQGFGVVGHTCFVHPTASLQEAIAILSTSDVRHLVPKLMPMLAVEQSLVGAAGAQVIAQNAWDLAALAERYQVFLQRYQPIYQTLQRPDALYEVPAHTLFLLRTLLVHDYRKLMLRDPHLPSELLPMGWCGHEARRLCGSVYRLLIKPTEQFLDGFMQRADGTVPRADARMLDSRFNQENLLG